MKRTEIVGFPNYIITTEGEIFNKKTNRHLKLQYRGGYFHISLYDEEKKKNSFQVHVLVARSFISNPNVLPVVNHKDGNKKNNSAGNLEWMSYQENNKHARETGLQGYYKRKVCQIDQEENVVARFESITEAAKKTGIDSRLICNVCKGKRRTTGGFFWCYENEETWIRPTHKACRRVEKLNVAGDVLCTYNSAKEASEDVRCSTGSMSNVLTGRLKTLKGYKWSYVEEEKIVDSLFEETRKWKKVVGYPCYRVSEDGRIYSEKRKALRKLTKNASGYFRVGLTDNGKEKGALVHVLVASAYLSNPENFPIVNHKNGIKTDNRVENLEWCTYQRNAQHAHDTDLCSSKKKVIQYTKCGEEVKRYDSIKEAADSVGSISYYTISRVARKKARSKTAGGYIWRFENEPLREGEKIVLNSKKKSIIQYDNNGDEITRYDSITDALIEN